MLWILALGIFRAVSATPQDICDQTFDVLRGETRTINYFHPDGYRSHQDCVFHLRGVGAERLMITFVDFDIEKHSRCGFDYLDAYDGPNLQSHKIGRYCGYIAPQSIRTQGNTATFRFVSDRTVSKQGFILEFNSISVEQFTGQCLPTLTKSTGSFQSPLYPSNYPNRVNCTYEISPLLGSQILITFSTLQIESSSYCVMDYVTIKTRAGVNIGPKLCGDLSGNSYIIPSSDAIINFVSDRSSTRLGFELIYRVVETCKELDDVCESGCIVGDDGMLQCKCKPGFEAPKGEAQCYDVDECRINNGGCQDHCKNTQGSYECECLRNGLFLAPNKLNCTDRTCAVNNAGCEHSCHINGFGGYYCTCMAGFAIDANQHNCSDIDECKSKKFGHGCEQECVNEPGSYYCDCGEGYVLSSNRRTCNDIDECQIQSHQCEQDCQNTPGSWHCTCYTGYELEPISGECRDTDECNDPDKAPKNCSDCINFEGGYTCNLCEQGFILSIDETECNDINECLDGNGGCQQECLNTPGSFYCGCSEGQQLVEGSEAQGICEDINECAPNNGRGPCAHYCENLPGSYDCQCLDGYQVVAGIRCEDINECHSANGGCAQSCVNTEGSFQCTCFPGYRQGSINGNCTDVDECLEDKPCNKDLGARCINSIGSFMCQCPSGYTVVNNTICQDIDECANGTFGPTHGCAQQCVNTAGSFRCICFEGYVELGNNSCADVNECSQSLCQHTELCQNTLGSFTCGCRPGYFLIDDGRSCSDVDECASDTTGSLCDQICLNEIGTHKCACNQGYELADNNFTCVDVNECARNTSGCSDGCTNFEGYFACFCHQGYQFVNGSNTTCVDTDECATNNGDCHHVCENNQGSFSCSCRPGYQAGVDERCHDIDECATANGGCDQTCKNSNGTYACSCDPDFKLGNDTHSCSHCPDCETFEKLLATVEELKVQQKQVEDLKRVNMDFAARMSRLEDRMRIMVLMFRSGRKHGH